MKQEGDDYIDNILVCLVLVYVTNCTLLKRIMFNQRKLGMEYMSYHFCMGDSVGGGGDVFDVVLTGSSCL
jgi:hypothetical protein